MKAGGKVLDMDPVDQRAGQDERHLQRLVEASGAGHHDAAGATECGVDVAESLDGKGADLLQG